MGKDYGNDCETEPLYENFEKICHHHITDKSSRHGYKEIEQKYQFSGSDIVFKNNLYFLYEKLSCV